MGLGSLKQKMSDVLCEELNSWYKSSSFIPHTFARCVYYSIARISSLQRLRLSEISRATKVLKEQGRLGKRQGFAWMEIAWWYLVRGYEPWEYLLYRFDEKNYTERRNFFNDIEALCFACIFNKRGDIPELTNKQIAYKRYRKFFNREQMIVNDQSKYEEFIKFLQRHVCVFVKPLRGSMGKGANIVKFSSEDENHQNFEKLCLYGPYIVEEMIVQCGEMNRLNSSSVNTVRISILQYEGTRKIMWTYLRVGRAGAVVDNAGSGGMFCRIDTKSGRLTGHAVNENGEFFICHPDSHVKFDGFLIPQWDKVLEFSTKIADEMRHLHYISLDIAVAEAGPCLVEGNCNGQFFFVQGCSQHGQRETYEKFLDDFRMKRMLNEVQK